MNALITLVVLALIATFATAIKRVPADQVHSLYRRGKPYRLLQPGTHMALPLIDRVEHRINLSGQVLRFEEPLADAHDVLESLPGGLDGELTERGRSLSGGQRQRVALARALLTDPEFLVLVEPTSAVDAHTEARIAARLADARRGRATLVVSASPVVLEHVDEVQLVEDGRLVARGRHEELLSGAAGARVAERYGRIVGRRLDDENATAARGADLTGGAP